MEAVPLIRTSSVGGSKRSLLSKSGFGQTESKTVLWKTFIVRSLFLLLTILCSVSVGWFFAGGKFIVEFPQTSPFIVSRTKDLPSPVQLEDGKKAPELVQEQVILNENDKSDGIDYDATPEHCVRQKDRLYFLKTHKTASSVIENILYRYGLRTDKTFAFPSNGALIFNYRKPFAKKMMLPLPDRSRPDILQQHTRYSKEVADLFPKSDSYRITILRDPGTLFPSLFKYFPRNPPFKQAKTVENFVSSPEKYSRAGGADFVTRNSMTFQMGFDNFLKTLPSDDEMAEIISAVDNEFDLVLLSEYLPQSLILLRHLLCMTWSDIATMSKNISQRKHFEEDTKEKIRRWQNVDTRVYEAANMTFWRKVKEFGEEKMTAEMAILEKMNTENAEKCVKGYRPVKELAVEFRDYEPPGLTIEGIELKEGYTDVCYNIALSPFSLAIDILDKQCQSSSFLRKYMHMEDRPKRFGTDCQND
ncbi:Oidioi.mRNA.OKI2018_I69.XSR.g15459.t1.cds [Oikopleura dioica]|uniref:Oidioi.mRNA.OKI2018_I69.XSR.g15459.t1.cds n=1 Tax=Oikopleura dioica TaxID=34765 RepID=A0ABN7SDH9_OIKDI|nr:Oidioi.mRNA.OKI2018_I69.XSR.g15459.t1.cds [Oikopleura dioica]